MHEVRPTRAEARHTGRLATLSPTSITSTIEVTTIAATPATARRDAGPVRQPLSVDAFIAAYRAGAEG
jgi:hypothetical protein